jgi:hypothetical protein
MGFLIRSLGAGLEAVRKVDIVVLLNLIDPLLRLNCFHCPLRCTSVVGFLEAPSSDSLYQIGKLALQPVK